MNLPEDFDLNSFANWRPSCRRCNSKKGDHIFRATPIIQRELDRTRNKAGEAKEIYNRKISDRKIDKAVGTLIQAGLPPDAPVLDELSQLYASANSQTRWVFDRISAAASEEWLGFKVQEPRRVYVPPTELRLSPTLTVSFDRTAQANSEGPFVYTVYSDDRTDES